jgi:hypothetical protein
VHRRSKKRTRISRRRRHAPGRGWRGRKSVRNGPAPNRDRNTGSPRQEKNRRGTSLTKTLRNPTPIRRGTPPIASPEHSAAQIFPESGRLLRGPLNPDQGPRPGEGIVEPGRSTTERCKKPDAARPSPVHRQRASHGTKSAGRKIRRWLGNRGNGGPTHSEEWQGRIETDRAGRSHRQRKAAHRPLTLARPRLPPLSSAPPIPLRPTDPTSSPSQPAQNHPPPTSRPATNSQHPETPAKNLPRPPTPRAHHAQS